MASEKAVLYIKGLSAEVKRHFKAYCVKQGKTMTQAIEEMMLEKIKQDGFTKPRYKWVAVMDKLTCSRCSELNNKIFTQEDFQNGKVGTPPIHRKGSKYKTACRCYLIRVI